MTSSLLNTQLKDFLPLSKLGQGAFSTVYKVKRINDNQVYALKKIKIQKLSQKQKTNALNEIRILASIKSNYIISYKEAFYDQSLNLLCIVMEYANGGDLQKKITDSKKSGIQIPQKQIWRAASQILVGLHVLHERGILHRDLKSANVFVSNEKYKLGDLNVSKINDQKDQMARTQTGTPYYASPEVWRDEPYDSKCDIWSLGCLIYEMCCFEPPFQGSDLDQLYKNVQRGRYKEISKVYSDELGSLIKLCLQVNPRQRPSAQELFRKFRKLNEKYLECLKIHEFESDSKLINTIRLPSDMKQLSKNLPLPEYQTNTKEDPQMIHSSCDQENKETVMLKNKLPSQNSQLNVAPLPQRIKRYFDNAKNIVVPKRPQRPRTTSKQRPKKENQNILRPSSAYVKKIMSKEDKVKPLPEVIKPAYNPSQYRCKSSQSHKNPRVPQRINSPKQRYCPNIPLQNKNVFSAQKNTPIDPSLQENISINKKLYENCKQNSLKKISSLQKKVRYIRDQRKERKVMMEKNKENLSCILKPIDNDERLDMKQCLKDKIKQNSQIFRSKPFQKASCYMPTIHEKVNSSEIMGKIYPSDRKDVLNVILEKRNQNLVNRRYVASADSKRVRSFTQASNEESVKENVPRYDVPGIRKKIGSHLPQVLSNNRIVSSKSYTVNGQQKGGKENLVQTNCERIEKAGQGHVSLIDDEETILRLKRRIKNRMIGHEGELRSQLKGERNGYRIK